MRLAHIIWSFNIGGTETMLVEIINRQLHYGPIKLFIINNDYNPYLIKKINDKVKVEIINRPPSSKNILFFLKLWIKLFFYNPDTIHCHNETIAKLLPGFKKKLFLTVHGPEGNTNYYHLYKKIFAISKFIQNYIRNEEKLNSIIVYNGININKIEVKNNFNFKVFKIIQISRLNHKHKAQDVLINAINYLVKNLNFKNIKLDMYGEGPSFEYLENLISNNNLQEYISLKGSLDKDKLYHLISEYNLLVQPSNYEGFGLTVIEGMAAQIPVLVSNVDGPLEIIQNGLYGSHFIKGDYVDCAMKIYNIISSYFDCSSFDKLYIAREHVIKNYNINDTADKYYKEYILL